VGELRVSPEAEQDLLDIWLFIADDSPANADAFLDRLAAAAQRIADFSDLGRERPELAHELRSFPLDRYVLFYRPTPAGIEVVRVLHGSRDVDRLF
jgi:toxin ParE1/3/4